MTSSSSCSSRGLGRRAAVLIAALAACAHAPPRPPAPAVTKLAVFPVQNATGGPAPIRAVSDALDAALEARGVSVLPRRELDAALAEYRIRFTGGVDRQTAKVLRDLGVDAVLVPTLEQYAADAPPKLALTVRLIDTTERPEVLWADGLARSGDDSPGLLARGVVTDPGQLQQIVVSRVAESVARHLASQSEGGFCGEAGRFKPRRKFRAPVLDDVGRRSIAVLPFSNHTSRRSAGDVVLGQFVAQLARSGSFEVLDPGLVREQLLSHRIVLEGGVSVDQALAMLDLLGADLVLSGYVELYEARSGAGAPRVEFTAYVLDRRTAELVWSSSSNSSGDDGVWFFGAGRVYSAPALSCRMVRGVVDAIVGHRPPIEPPG
jgi:TolB-like protein